MTEKRTPSVLGTFLLIFSAMALLFAADTFLEKADEAARRSEARRLFEEGQRFQSEGQLHEAIDAYRTALSNARGSREYKLALANALLAEGKLTDAEASVEELLATESTDAEANLVLARVLVREGRVPRAIAYYHRAIYGQWNKDADENRVKARFELVDLLARQGAKRELLAELLPLQDQAPSDIETSMRLGRLYLTAGAPNRAAEVFRPVLRHNPRDGDAYAGFGEAELALGNYRAAQADFQAALRFQSSDPQVPQHLALASQVLALDPTGRGVATEERYRRSRKLVELALAGAQRCAGGNPPPALAALAEEARKRRTDPEADLDLAERIWQARAAGCTDDSPQSEALGLVMARLSR